MAVSKKSLANLKNIQDNIKPEDNVTNGKKGGIASGKSRREKKEMKELVQDVLSMNIKAGKADDFKNLAESKGKNITVKEALVLAQVKKAMVGDTKSLEFLLRQSGEYTEKEQAEIEALKAKAGNNQEEIEDDGFLEAIKSNAAEDWEKEKEEEE